MTPRQRLVAALALAPILIAALFLAVRDDSDDEKVNAGLLAFRTTTSRGVPTMPAPSTTVGGSTTTGGNTSTTRRFTATTRRNATTSARSSTTSSVVDRVALQRVATLDQPVAFAVRPGDAGTVFIAEQGGRVRSLSVSGSTVNVNPTVVLDISAKVSTGGEQGLLGIAFPPSGNVLYADYTDVAGNTRVVEYPFANGVANASAERLVLAVDQPYSNHNGGQLVFGPDGFLYIGLGDGGSSGDPQGNGQRLDTLLGKILRIDAAASGSNAYTVPGNNPFVGQSGARGEIWHYGVRNPWRFSFDRANGEQWIADVGQNAWEEIDHVAAGRAGVNFGWNRREGNHAYNGGTKPASAVDPEYELSHNDGNCSITGGFVYRGAAIRGLAGTYVFADYCKGDLMGAANGSLRSLNASLASPSSFGEDAGGELWALSLDGPVYRLVRA